jgi:hypothetical protein
MTDRDPHVTLVRPQGCEHGEQTELPHEQLDVYDVLEEAYRTAISWQGISWAKGSVGDQLKRSASSAVLRYTEGYYADGGNKATLWKGARASCGEAAAAVQTMVAASPPLRPTATTARYVPDAPTRRAAGPSAPIHGRRRCNAHATGSASHTGSSATGRRGQRWNVSSPT